MIEWCGNLTYYFILICLLLIRGLWAGTLAEHDEVVTTKFLTLVQRSTIYLQSNRNELDEIIKL